MNKPLITKSGGKDFKYDYARISIYLDGSDVELKERVRDAAKKAGVSMNKLLTAMLKHYFKGS